MRVVALGGAGVMGRYGVKDLASKDSVEELLIADYDRTLRDNPHP